MMQTVANGNSNATSALSSLMSAVNLLDVNFDGIRYNLASLWDTGFSSSLGLIETARYVYACVCI